MVEGLIGRKVGMTQLYEPDGTAVPVTVLRAGPCVVVAKRTKERDGYEAVRLGYVEKVNTRRVNKPQRGYLEKHSLPLLRTQKEFSRLDEAEVNVGDRVLVTMFAPADTVDVVGTSKGKGFQGVMKRHHFSGGAASHGSMFHRAPGSIGASSFPSRVFKGQRMAGRMGGDTVTVKNLQVVRVDEENNLLVVRGAVPGARGAILYIKKAKSSRGVVSKKSKKS
ncbi:MAG: 50S ribosomal protein L3 [Acidobacteria bacterium]|nr:50S ribosomal protein L3 [Acidobacteriota bacterium]